MGHGFVGHSFHQHSQQQQQPQSQHQQPQQPHQQRGDGDHLFNPPRPHEDHLQRLHPPYYQQAQHAHPVTPHPMGHGFVGQSFHHHGQPQQQPQHQPQQPQQPRQQRGDKDRHRRDLRQKSQSQTVESIDHAIIANRLAIEDAKYALSRLRNHGPSTRELEAMKSNCEGKVTTHSKELEGLADMDKNGRQCARSRAINSQKHAEKASDRAWAILEAAEPRITEDPVWGRYPRNK